MAFRGIRGAITIEENTQLQIVEATKEILEAVISANKIKVEDIASVFFSVTKDLDAEFPALAARQIGLTDTPLLCLNEISVPGSLPKCIRVLLHVNSEVAQSKCQHIYLKDAIQLRPDIQ